MQYCTWWLMKSELLATCYSVLPTAYFLLACAAQWRVAILSRLLLVAERLASAVVAMRTVSTDGAERAVTSAATSA